MCYEESLEEQIKAIAEKAVTDFVKSGKLGLWDVVSRSAEEMKRDFASSVENMKKDIARELSSVVTSALDDIATNKTNQLNQMVLNGKILDRLYAIEKRLGGEE